MDPRCGDWLSQPQMEDGAHRKRGLLREKGGTGGWGEDGNRKGKRVKREQATDESPSVFRGKQEWQ